MEIKGKSRGYFNMDTLEQIFIHYGYNCQQEKLIEECSELIRAIVKKDDRNFVEEMADVTVIIEQFINHYPKMKEQFERVKEEKERIKNEETKNSKRL